MSETIKKILELKKDMVKIPDIDGDLYLPKEIKFNDDKSRWLL